MPGEMPDILTSHFDMATGLTTDPEQLRRIEEIRQAHLAGGKVMEQFKTELTVIVQCFIAEFQARRVQVVADPSYIQGVLERGTVIAKKNADETLSMVHTAMEAGSLTD